MSQDRVLKQAFVLAVLKVPCVPPQTDVHETSWSLAPSLFNFECS